MCSYLKQLLARYKTDPDWYPLNIHIMVDFLKCLIDEYIGSPGDELQPRKDSILCVIKWLRRAEPKIFYQAKKYLGAKRRKLLAMLLKMPAKK